MERMVASLKKYLGPHWPTLLFATIFAIGFGVTLFCLCFALSEIPREQGINVLILLLGLILGWWLGMFFSPYSKTDVDRFRFLGKAVVGFISGYVLSKFEDVLSALIQKAAGDVYAVPWAQVALFVAGLLLASVVVFVSRVHAVRETADGPLPTPQAQSASPA